METPFIPSWSRVVSAMPTVLDELKQAVELDNAEFGNVQAQQTVLANAS